MARTFEKILLGIIFVVLVGFNSFFIIGQQNNAAVIEDITGKANLNIPLKEINEEQAKTIALGVVNGMITEIEEKTVNGVTFYEVEIENGNTETEIKIDKKDGDILQVKHEEKEDEEEEDEEVSSEELQNINGILTEEQAVEIALNLIHGIYPGLSRVKFLI